LKQVDSKGERAAEERAKKIRSLEDKLKAIVQELHDLRGIHDPLVPPTTMPAQYGSTRGYYYEPVTNYRTEGNVVVPVTSYVLRTYPEHAPAPESIPLSRATYKLPAEKAKAMATLLGEVKGTVMEVKVEGDKLIVTTTPEAQATVAQMVGLVTGASTTRRPASTPGYPAPPYSTPDYSAPLYNPPPTPSIPSRTAPPTAPQPTTSTTPPLPPQPARP